MAPVYYLDDEVAKSPLQPQSWISTLGISLMLLSLALAMVLLISAACLILPMCTKTNQTTQPVRKRTVHSLARPNATSPVNVNSNDATKIPNREKLRWFTASVLLGLLPFICWKSLDWITPHWQWKSSYIYSYGSEPWPRESLLWWAGELGAASYVTMMLLMLVAWPLGILTLIAGLTNAFNGHMSSKFVMRSILLGSVLLILQMAMANVGEYLLISNDPTYRHTLAEVETSKAVRDGIAAILLFVLSIWCAALGAWLLFSSVIHKLLILRLYRRFSNELQS